MRVLHLVQCGATTGGTVSHVATQVAHQVRLGLEVGVVAAGEGVLTEHCRESGADVFVDSSLLPDLGDTSHPGSDMSLLDLGSRWRPDLVHAHLMHAGFRGKELADAIGVTVLYTQHMFDSIDPFLQAVRISGATISVIAVSKYVQQKLNRIFNGTSRIYFVPNGVNTPASSDFGLAPSSGPKILYCGRLSHEKGPDLAVLGFKIVLSTHPDATLHIVGAGPDETLLRRIASSLNLGKHVHFYGSVSGALQPNLGADLLFAPSRGDASSLVVLEAMASQVPIISTKMGGIPEIIRDQRDGLLVTSDSPEELAHSALSVLASKDRGASLAESALDRFRLLYKADTMVDRTCAVYDAVISERHN